MSGSGTGNTPATTARTSRTCATGPGLTSLRVLVLNTGSSSIKGSLVDSDDLRAIAKDEVSLGTDATRRQGLERTVRNLLRKLRVTSGTDLDAVGHPAIRVPRPFGGMVAGAGRDLAGSSDGRSGAGCGPPWQRLLGYGGAAWSIRGDVDGIDSDGGADDGDPVGVDRPRHPSIYVAPPPCRLARAGAAARSRVRPGRRL